MHFNPSQHSCQEHVISPLLDPTQLFDTPALPASMGVLLAIATGLFFFTLRAFGEGTPPAILHRMRYLSWIWAKTLPFKSQRGFLPHFVAQRDA